MKIFLNLNLILLILSIFPVIFSSIKGIITLPFEKRVSDLSNISPDDIISSGLQKNYLFTNIKIGTKPQTIPAKVDLFSYLFLVKGENEEKNNSALFQQSKSETFEILSNVTFSARGFTNGYKVSDYFSNNGNEKINISFILVTETQENNQCILGLRLNDTLKKDIVECNFIHQLKKNNIINDYYFTIKYSNETNGNLIIGDLLENYDKKYKNLEFKDTYVQNPDSEKSWNIKIDLFYTAFSQSSEKITFPGMIGYFKLDLGVTIGSENFREDLLNYFMTKKIEEGICHEIINEYYYMYYCKKDVDLAEMKNLYFYNKDLNFTFEFKPKDLFYYNEKDGNLYYLIEFEKNVNNKNNRWLFGETFFKKYDIIFNQNKKKVGIYVGAKISENNNWFSEYKWYLILIFALIIVLACLVIISYKYLKTIYKRKKANELTDDYDYTININNA